MFKKSSSANDIVNTLNFLLNKKAVAQLDSINKYEDLIKSLSSCAEKADSLDLGDIAEKLSNIVVDLSKLSSSPDSNSADFIGKNHDYDGDNYLNRLDSLDILEINEDDLNSDIINDKVKHNFEDVGDMLFTKKDFKKAYKK